MREEYFSAVKLTGVGGIIMPFNEMVSSNLANAKKHGLSFWSEFDKTQKETLTYLDIDSSDIIYCEKETKVLALNDLKEVIKSMSKSDRELLDGIIVKYPDFSSFLWDESFKEDYYNEFSNYIEDYLYLLFEPAEKQVAFRSWYFEKCSDFVYKKYICPLIKWAKSKGINLCFDIGKEESEYYYLKRHVDIMYLLEKGVSLCVNHNPNGITETCIMLSKYSGNSFVVSNYDSRIDSLSLNFIAHAKCNQDFVKKSKDCILLIRASRGVMQRCVEADNEDISVTENDAVKASLEGTYYTDMLFEKGFQFEITSEKLFEKHAKFKNGIFTYKDKKINQVLLCNSCVFTKKGIKLLNSLLDGGVCINNANLINILGSDLI